MFAFNMAKEFPGEETVQLCHWKLFGMAYRAVIMSENILM